MKKKDVEAAIADALSLDSDEVVVTQALDNGHVTIKLAGLELEDSTDADDAFLEIDEDEDDVPTPEPDDEPLDD